MKIDNWLSKAAEAVPRQAALVASDETLSFEELERRAISTARRLAALGGERRPAQGGRAHVRKSALECDRFGCAHRRCAERPVALLPSAPSRRRARDRHALRALPHELRAGAI